jgi:MEDS: MEthanogen/methylotroph, DcmR Sensory domain
VLGSGFLGVRPERRVVAVELQDVDVCTGEHIVQFYERDSDLVESVGRYLTDAAQAGEVAIVIATDRRALAAHLEAAGIDLEAADRAGTFVSLDAATTMGRFVSEGEIDREAFSRVIGGVLRQAARTGRPLRVFGEMVAILWDAGDVLAAIELETLWNELGHRLSFALYCAYHSQSVSGDEHSEALEQICHLHSSVLPAPSAHGRAEPSRSSDGNELTRQFPAQPNAPQAARDFVADALQRWGHHEGLFLDDAQLAVSELATNAVVHARSPFSVALRAEAQRCASRSAITARSPPPCVTRDRWPLPGVGCF